MSKPSRVLLTSTLSAAIVLAATAFAPSRAAAIDHGIRSALAAVSAAQPQADPDLVRATTELRWLLNDFCLAMYRTYNDETVEFYDAYREAYELLQVSKKVEDSAAAGGSTRAIGKSLAEIAGEIHHIEHHLGEFAARPGIAEASKQNVAARFEKAESALAALTARLHLSPDEGHDHEGHEHEGHEHGAAEAIAPPLDRARLASSSVQFVSRMNSFCLAMYQGYNDRSQAFNDAYREAYELLQAAKKADGKVRAGEGADAIADALSQIDGEIHHVEIHLSEFAAVRVASGGAADDNVLTQFDAAESVLHDMLAQLGVKQKHVDAHEQDEEAEAAARENDAGQLARDMSVAATSLWRAMEHNYKGNPDFREAHGEALEFANTCRQIASLIQGDQVDAEARGLISGLDGEIHHLEEHITGFAADDADERAGVGRAKRKLEDVELLLHALMKRTGIEKKHVD